MELAESVEPPNILEFFQPPSKVVFQ